MDIGNLTSKITVIALLAVICIGTGVPVQAHPMGNFAICHYTRFEAARNGLRLRYVMDMAEIPTVGEKQSMDTNHDGIITDVEQAAYLAAKATELRADVTLTANGKPIALTQTGAGLKFSPGAAGLETLKITLDWQAALPPKLTASQRPYQVTYIDNNYPTRTGWKEIVAGGGPDAALKDSSVPATDRSDGLSIYPRNLIPPQDTQAQFTVLPGVPAAMPAPPAPQASADSSPATPRDAFTQAIARRQLTPGLMLAGLLIAFIFGAFHALSPGHGKTMVAAYLVGSRGTAKHAAQLGMIVTITHTLGVFLLGLATLFAAQYIVPEKLYPILSAISGLAVCGVGTWLLISRLRGLSDQHHHDHDHDREHEHVHDHDHEHSYDHTHDHAHTHSHGMGHHHYHHVPEGPVTARTLVALGISGGIVPCPSALVVLLSAIALHRIGYGLILISAFSLGLASVLIAIGLIVVSTRNWVARIPIGDALLQRLPVASAAAITLIGIVLVIRALG